MSASGYQSRSWSSQGLSLLGGFDDSLANETACLFTVRLDLDRQKVFLRIGGKQT
jgi:hypothetical protein